MPRVTSRGQVTIPKATREALGIGPGSEVEFVVRGNEAVMRKASIRAAIERWKGFLGQENTTDQIMDVLRGAARE